MEISKISLITILILSSLMLSVSRNRVWTDESLLWADSAAKSKGKARPHSNLAWVDYRMGFFDKALEEAKKSITLYYYHPQAHYVIGLVLYKKGHYFESLKAYAWALLLIRKYHASPIYESYVRNSTGLVYKELGDYDHAKVEFAEAIRLNTFLDEARLNMMDMTLK